jgi:hypothetical protein
MTAYRVTCITKPGNHYDPYTRIQRLGGDLPSPWNDTEAKIIECIGVGHTFYVERGGSRSEVRIDWSGEPPSLPECQ